MIIDARQIQQSSLETDICIIGAGPAGLSLANALVKKNRKVTVIESGGLNSSPSMQHLNQGSTLVKGPDAYTLNLPYYLSKSRIRTLGGTSVVWGGHFASLDAIDFTTRSWVPNSGWPIDKKNLASFEKDAAQELEIGSFGLATSPAAPPHYKTVTFDPQQSLTTKMYHQHPIKLHEKYLPLLQKSPHLNLFYCCTATQIELNTDKGKVSRIHLRTPNNKKIQLRANAFVLATGGIENARLLLASNQQLSQGVGNGYDNVGRYFMEHIHAEIAACYFPPNLHDWRLYLDSRKDLQKNPLGLWALSEQTRKDKQLLGYYGLAKFLDYQSPNQLPLTEGNIIKATNKINHERFNLPTPQKSRPQLLKLFSISEQMPHRDSRLILETPKDAFDVPRIKLNWLIQEKDIHSAFQSIDQMGRVLLKQGKGRLKRLVSPQQYLDHARSMFTGFGGHHHMGTTRMHENPKLGVVDKNCKVHGIKNLFMAGSSVFTTGGSANPTFTIVALALRLANHLAKKGGQ